MIARSLSVIAFAGMFAFAAPASAQEEELELSDNVQTAILYGEDAAPPCPEDTICVIARLPEDDRFRIPENLRYSDDPANQSWVERVERLDMVGRFGTLSCSAKGVGGSSGCTQEMIAAAFADKASSSSVRFGQLIEAARRERLSTIDADAAAEQDRVEQVEREYMERLERERAGPTGDETVDPSAPPAIDQADRVPPAEPSKDTPFDDGDEAPQPLGAQVPARDPQG